MEKLAQIQLLFIDTHQEWLNFAKSTLSNFYEVTTAKDLEILSQMQKGEKRFDLIFIGLSLAEKNIRPLGNLAKSSTRKWYFIILFPGSPDNKKLRMFFKAGIRDVLSKPYDAESLKKMVEEQMNFARKYREKLRMLDSDDDYKAQVSRLLEYSQTIIRKTIGEEK